MSAVTEAEIIILPPRSEEQLQLHPQPTESPLSPAPAPAPTSQSRLLQSPAFSLRQRVSLREANAHIRSTPSASGSAEEEDATPSLTTPRLSRDNNNISSNSTPVATMIEIAPKVYAEPLSRGPAAVVRDRRHHQWSPQPRQAFASMRSVHGGLGGGMQVQTPRTRTSDSPGGTQGGTADVRITVVPGYVPP